MIDYMRNLSRRANELLAGTGVTITGVVSNDMSSNYYVSYGDQTGYIDQFDLQESFDDYDAEPFDNRADALSELALANFNLL